MNVEGVKSVVDQLHRSTDELHLLLSTDLTPKRRHVLSLLYKQEELLERLEALGVPESMFSEFRLSLSNMRSVVHHGALSDAFRVLQGAQDARKRLSVVHSRNPILGSLLWMSEFFVSQKRYVNVFEPLIADYLQEWTEAKNRGRRVLAAFVIMRALVVFAKTLGLDRAFAFVSFLVKAWKSVN